MNAVESGKVIVSIGDLVEDIVVWPSGPLVPGTDNPSTIVRSRGGSAANVAVFAAAMSPTRFIGRVGSDAAGRALTAELERDGVDVRAQFSGRTGTIVLCIDAQGERTMYPDRGAAAELAGVPEHWADGAAITLISLYSLAQSDSAATVIGLARHAAAAGSLIAIDLASIDLIDSLGPLHVIELLQTIRPDVCFANADEATRIRVETITVLGATYVVKNGAGPVIVHHAGQPPTRVVPEPVAAVHDTTGAGDAFAAGYLAALAHGADHTDAATAGNRLAARVLANPGANLHWPHTPTGPTHPHPPHRQPPHPEEKTIPRSIILDCDPGHDDVLAMFVAHGSHEIDLIAVTTVCGNQTVDKVTENALAVSSLAGMDDVRVARGADRPLARPHRPAPDIHGDTGLDGPDLPRIRKTLDTRTAAQLIVDEVMSRPAGSITLVATAPLTNLALALRLEPAIADRTTVAIMGGAIDQGNVTASAEFNILVDPEAAREVFDAAWQVTMFGLEVTHQALATPDVRRRITEIDSPIAAFTDELLEFFGSTYAEHQNFDAPPVHDLCPVVYLIDPSVFTVRDAPISVETRGDLTLGRTVVDLRPGIVGGRHRVAIAIDVDRFWTIAIAAIANLTSSHTVSAQSS